MKNIQIKTLLTPDELEMINCGEAYLNTVLKDSRTNQYIDFKDAEIIDTSQQAGKYALIGVGITLVVAAVAKATVAIVKHAEKKKMLNENPAFALSLKYNTSMIKYANGIKKGKPSLKDIKNMIEALKTVLKDYKTGDVTIELSNKDINNLYGMIYKFTKALCDAKKIDLDDKYSQIDFEKDENKIIKIEYIQEMLFVQQTIYA